MTYNLINDSLVPVRSICYNNRRIANPPDALVVSLGLGLPLISSPMPEYDGKTQYVTQTYRQDESAIVEVWTVNDAQLETSSEP